MNKLPCELIEDLLPSYVDGLTNEVTNQLVGEHINSCADCDKKYRQMKNPLASADDERGAKEIDFLKTTKKMILKMWVFLLIFLSSSSKKLSSQTSCSVMAL